VFLARTGFLKSRCTQRSTGSELNYQSRPGHSEAKEKEEEEAGGCKEGGSHGGDLHHRYHCHVEAGGGGAAATMQVLQHIDLIRYMVSFL
jgi:hypothetical protein